MENGRLWLGAMVFSDFSAEHFSIYHDQFALRSHGLLFSDICPHTICNRTPIYDCQVSMLNPNVIFPAV